MDTYPYLAYSYPIQNRQKLLKKSLSRLFGDALFSKLEHNFQRRYSTAISFIYVLTSHIP